MERMGDSRRSAATATSVMMVEQLGLAMIPRCCSASSGLISGTTSGTSSSMRKALELSINTAPAARMAGAKRRAISFSAAPNTISAPEKAASVASSTVISRPAKGSFLPTLRALARQRSSPTGNCRSSSTLSISRPTAPVAPRTVML